MNTENTQNYILDLYNDGEIPLEEMIRLMKNTEPSIDDLDGFYEVIVDFGGNIGLFLGDVLFRTKDLGSGFGVYTNGEEKFLLEDQEVMPANVGFSQLITKEHNFFFCWDKDDNEYIIKELNQVYYCLSDAYNVWQRVDNVDKLDVSSVNLTYYQAIKMIREWK